jgi:hypothetical protein
VRFCESRRKIPRLWLRRWHRERAQPLSGPCYQEDRRVHRTGWGDRREKSGKVSQPSDWGSNAFSLQTATFTPIGLTAYTLGSISETMSWKAVGGNLT